MFSAYSIPVLPALAGFEAYYEQQQLQTVNRAPSRRERYQPYTRTPSKTTVPDILGTSYFGYQFPHFQDNSLVQYQKEQDQLTQGFQKIEKISCDTTRGSLEDYGYPTLSFLLPYNKMPVLNSSLGTTYSSAGFCGNVNTTKKEQDELHPFYKRQMLATAIPRDGLTRTRDKYRVVYTEKQRKYLEQEYQINSFISESRRSELAKETDLSERQIKFWFQNRRAKDKRNRKSTGNKRVTIKEKEIDSISNRSPTTVIAAISNLDDAKHIDKPSCRYSRQQKHDPKNVGDQQDFAPITRYHSNSAYEFPVSEISNKPVTASSGSCRFENWNTNSRTTSISPPGCQVEREHILSPSEWTLTNQRRYLFDRVDMSPLFSGIQPSLDYRI